MEENNNLENRIIDENQSSKNLKINKWFIIIPVILIIAIVLIIVLSIALKKDKKEQIKKICEEGEEDKCLKCDKNICISCNPKYNLINGECHSNFSLKAIYESISDDENIQLIHKSFKDNIIDIEIDDEKALPCTEHIFHSPGIHTIYFLIDNSNLTSLSYMFGNIDELISVKFTND